MIDGYKMRKYLHNTGLHISEFWTLYEIMMQEQITKGEVFKIPNVNSNEATFNFSVWTEEYHKKHQYYLGNKINNRQVIDDLEDRGYIENWDRNNYEINKMRVTDKFKDTFLINDVESAFNEFIELYPSWVIVNSHRYPSMDMARDEMIIMYNEKILLGGNKLNHLRCMAITDMYLGEGNFKDGAPMKISKYFNAFENIANLMENKKPTNNNNPFNEAL